MFWFGEHKKDMQLLLSTLDAVIDFWPASSRSEARTHEWTEDITALLGVLLQRQSMHYAREEAWLAHAIQEVKNPSLKKSLRVVLEQHPQLREAVTRIRDDLRHGRVKNPSDARGRVAEVLESLRQHENTEAMLVESLVKALPVEVRSSAREPASPQAQDISTLHAAAAADK